jgi:hypothetical protein
MEIGYPKCRDPFRRQAGQPKELQLIREFREDVILDRIEFFALSRPEHVSNVDLKIRQYSNIHVAQFAND